MNRYSWVIRSTFPALAPALTLALALAGCTNQKKTESVRAVYDDSDPATSGSPSSLASTTASESAVDRKDAASGTNTSTFTVDGMVGQVNGQALYANQLLDPIRDILQSLSRQGFTKQRLGIEVSRTIRRRINEHIFNALLLAEATKDLDERTMLGVDSIIRLQRAKLVRQKGSGSPTVADINLGGEGDGRAMNAELRRYREKLLISNYMRNKVWIKIDVRRKDIERYYHSNPEQFNAPEFWTVQFIQLDTSADADRIDQLLASGKQFAEVAKDPSNKFTAGTQRIQDGRLFDERLTREMRKLKAGEHTGRVQVKSRNGKTAYWWVYVEKIEPRVEMSLIQAQPAIRLLLTTQRQQQLQNELRKKLLGQVGRDEMEQMLVALMEVAMSRYAVGQ